MTISLTPEGKKMNYVQSSINASMYISSFSILTNSSINQSNNQSIITVLFLNKNNNKSKMFLTTSNKSNKVSFLQKDNK